jgi:hypothetical protein
MSERISTLSSDLPQPDEFQGINRLAERILPFAAGLLAICFLARLVVSWQNFGDLDTTSGVWTATAIDIADDGTLYRPLTSPLGYGGSRYAPLYPSLHAAIIHAGFTPIAAGYFLTIIAMLAAGAGAYTLMRRLNVPKMIAISLTGIVLAANCFLQGVAKIHGDPLAIALDLWGLVFTLSLTTPAVLLAAICFVLAPCAKITSIFGIATALAWLLLQGRRKQAIQLAILWVIGIALAILTIQLASGGRAISIFHQTASGGGGLSSLAQGPTRFFNSLRYFDHVACGFWLLAVALIIVARARTTLPAILLFITTAGTIAIFGSPGTGINHLMSLQIASILVIAVTLPKLQKLRPFAICAVLLLVVVGIYNCLRQTKDIREDKARDGLQVVLSDIRQSPVAGPIYANDPIIPILAGQRPYLLDGFMARLMRQKNPASADKLWDDLENARFSAVITNIHPSYWTDVVADDAVVARHLDKYYLYSVHDTFQIYLPNSK